jgi:hypothetical protein
MRLPPIQPSPAYNVTSRHAFYAWSIQRAIQLWFCDLSNNDTARSSHRYIIASPSALSLNRPHINVGNLDKSCSPPSRVPRVGILGLVDRTKEVYPPALGRTSFRDSLRSATLNSGCFWLVMSIPLPVVYTPARTIIPTCSLALQ